MSKAKAAAASVEVIDAPKVGAVVPHRESAPITPMDLVASALAQGRDLAVVQQLLDMQERWEKSEARKAFDDALAQARAKIKPVIRKTKGHNGKKYAALAALADEIDPIFAEYGLHYSWTAETSVDRISVTCELAHRLGHRKEATLPGPPDKTGNKNDIQAIGSTVQYLKRYTLELVAGLATKEGDDDGQAAGGDPPITKAQVEEITKALGEAGGDVAKFCTLFKVDALEEIRQSRFGNAMQVIEAKRLKRAAEERAKVLEEEGAKS